MDTSHTSAVKTLESIFDTRYSCRGYLDQPVPAEVVEDIVRLAQKTPSWCNSQPWQIHVTQPETTDALRAALATAGATRSGPDIPFPGKYEGVYQERRRESGWALYEALGIEKGDREASAKQVRENFRFFGAPHFALITTEAELGPYGVLDCGAFVTSFMLAARAHGVACIAQAAVAAYSQQLREFFGVPDQRQVVCGISFGYEDPDHPANRFRTTREIVGNVLSFV